MYEESNLLRRHVVHVVLFPEPSVRSGNGRFQKRGPKPARRTPQTSLHERWARNLAIPEGPSHLQRRPGNRCRHGIRGVHAEASNQRSRRPEKRGVQTSPRRPPVAARQPDSRTTRRRRKNGRTIAEQRRLPRGHARTPTQHSQLLQTALSRCGRARPRTQYRKIRTGGTARHPLPTTE